ncbi:MAG: hypothetical protein L0210_08330 [Rhodospirillales bacterium]|nr:hypothetical protein [Rhodospirillales bacterium]
MVRPFLKIAVVLALAAGVALGGKPVNSQPLGCGYRQTLVDWLRESYQEERAAFGLSVGGELVEVFVAPTGTWTILVSYPGGPTCILRAGDSWEGIQGLTGTAHDGPAV